MEELKYSVLMPVYEKVRPEYLHDSIESMLKQTVKPDQFVIVEDGILPDILEKVILYYEKKNDGLFTVIRCIENHGAAAALNLGLKSCRNNLVARMDSDDISLPERCEKELTRFQQDSSLDICGCQLAEFIHDDPQQRTLCRIVPCTDQAIKKFMRRRQPFNHPTVIYKKESVLKVGGYPDLRRKEDFDLFSRMLGSGCKASNVDEVLYLYRSDEDNYKRRKSWRNTTAAVKVYWAHYQRHGCSLFDFLVISGAEILFFLLPSGGMKFLSDHLLRKQADIL